MRCLAWFVLLTVSAGIIGCGETEEQRLDRMVPDAVDTVKVTGSVLVDGEPVKDLWVTLIPNDEKVNLRPRGQTDEDGKFSLTTYTGGDGAPAGEYKVTIAWLTYIKRDSDWGGPDKLKNQYNDPKTTPFDLTVADEPIEIPTYELKLKGVEGKPDPAGTAPVRRNRGDK